MVLVDGTRRADAAAERFERIAAAVCGVATRPQVSLDQVPAPSRLATFGVAVSADVVESDDELGSGRLVLLHEPGGHDAWDGEFRCVVFVRATVEGDLGSDPMLPAVGWSWLLEAMEAAELPAIGVGGTVTAVTNSSFGTMSDKPSGAEVEVRASWTPLLDDDALLEQQAGDNARVWLDLMTTAAGLPPLPDGVAALPRPRMRR